MKNKRLPALVIAALMLAALLSGCGGETQETPSGSAPGSGAAGSGAPSEQPTATEQTSTPPADDDPAEQDIEPNPDLGIRHAQNFSIDYMVNGVKLVTDSDGRRLLLTPRGVAAPVGYEDAVQVATPIERGMFTSTTYIGFIDALEDVSVYNAVAAVTTDEESWVNQHILDRFSDGTIRHVSQSHWDVGDIEDIVDIRPEIVFSGGGDEAGMKLRGLLDEVGIDYATVLDWTEEGASANLEWIKFFAAFYNLDELADSVYNAKLEQLAALQEMAANAPTEGRPVVAYGMVWSGTVYTQAGTSTLAQEIANAGGIYALSHIEGQGSITITMEEFLDRCRDADILIYGSLPAWLPDKAFLLETDPLFAEFAAFQNDQIFIFDQGYYMNSAKIVEKFADMVYMFHPSMLPGHELVMYQRLAD